MVGIGIGNVQRRRRVDAGQTPQGNQAIVVGLGIVARPTAAKEAKSVVAAIGRGVLEPSPIKLRGHVRSALVVSAVPSKLERKQSDGEQQQEEGNGGDG